MGRGSALSIFIQSSEGEIHIQSVGENHFKLFTEIERLEMSMFLYTFICNIQWIETNKENTKTSSIPSLDFSNG
jgi:hypothetical protein